MKYTIGLAQMESVRGNREYNLTSAKRMIKNAANKKVDILCFPEMFLSGYCLELIDENREELEDFENSKPVTEMIEMANRYDMELVLPLMIKRNGKHYNGAFFSGQKYKKPGFYAKNHLFGDEKNYFDIGNEYPVFDSKIGKIGICICYDLNFPEPCRILTLKGAKVIFVPSAWSTRDGYKWDLLLRARALENQVFIIGVNSYLNESDLRIYGQSQVVSPLGKTVILSIKEGDDLLVYDLDLDDIEESRKRNPYLKDINCSDYETHVEPL